MKNIKDEKHKREIEENLSKIHEQETSINDLLNGRNDLIDANNMINSRMESISSFIESEYPNEKISRLESVNIYIQHKGNLNIASEKVETIKLITDGTNNESSIINSDVVE